MLPLCHFCLYLQASEPLRVTNEQESAFDELFHASCRLGRDVAPVEEIVSRIRGIRGEGDEVRVLCV